MTKIYETHRDVERDDQKQKLQAAQSDVRHDFSSALASALVATASHTAEQLHQLESSIAKKPPSSLYSGMNKVLMWAGVVTGVISLISWFNAGKKAAAAESSLRALGPEEVKYPPLFPDEPAQSLTEGKHCDRLKQEVASPPTRPL